MTKEKIRKHLIDAGVKNLKEYGYPLVNSDNILTDYIYAEFFIAMLEQNMGNGEVIDDVIIELLNKIESNLD